eukprot:582535-Pyramimonas_sp.AAC.1
MEALKFSCGVVLEGSASNLMWETRWLLRLESVSEIQVQSMRWCRLSVKIGQSQFPAGQVTKIMSTTKFPDWNTFGHGQQYQGAEYHRDQ